MYCFIHKIVWHCGILLWMFHLNWLGTCSRMHMTKNKSQLSLDDLLASEFLYHFYASVNFVLSQAWLWRLLLSWLSLPSLLLAFTCTERERRSCFQIPETKLFQRVHYKFLCMVFQPFQVNLHALPLEPSKYFSFCDSVLAHEEVLWVILYPTCQTDFTNGLVAYTSAYPIILQKEVANGVPCPN